MIARVRWYWRRLWRREVPWFVWDWCEGHGYKICGVALARSPHVALAIFRSQYVGTMRWPVHPQARAPWKGAP